MIKFYEYYRERLDMGYAEFVKLNKERLQLLDLIPTISKFSERCCDAKKRLTRVTSRLIELGY